ncbi:DNA-binding transcriptional regulator, LysR family [Pseudomonas gessardii]|uniref:LysR family transcriptional regulator n=1 Tax=Pseudomonas gessardii TaxID=78544 RepID=UPI00087E3F77|nr:LysR family transcriptional regulator [Pseudomonas gessardii]MRU53518.1 LysR family transcriptional regulator [Pseudomonas gessardii]ONH38451.1 LysR family transcriptional regulator [Pseudomonas gessardii]SDQ60953.1 DNA-binding transcriptional regulator, LysR family [Pseudomonas gessardii]
MIPEGNSDCNSLISESRMPSLLALRCFESAARLENFARAADELHLTPGAISRAVRLLEEDLGVDLFERRSRRVFLTEAGRRLAKAVSEGLGLINQTVRGIRTDARRTRQLVLSCEPTLLMRWLIPRWSDFQAHHQGLDIHLVAGGGPFSFNQGIDLAIRRDDFPRPADYHAEPLFPEKVGPVCRPEKAEQWFGKRRQALLSSAPLLQTTSRPTAWQEWASAKGLPTPAMDMQPFEHFYFSIQAAVAGLGVAIGPWHLVRDDIQSGVLAAPLGFVEDGSQYCLLSPTAPKLGSVEMELLEWLQAVG